MFKVETGTSSNTIDIGGVVTAVITIPSGYEYLALRTAEASDWTVVLNKLLIRSNQVAVEFRKVVSGSATVTLTASVICRKI